MPEGHTIHALAERLQAGLGGATVTASSPQGRFSAGAALLDGLVLAATEAHGTHLWIHFGDGELLHRLRLDPATPGCDVPDRLLKELWEDLVTLMPLGVATGRILTRERDIEAARAAVAAKPRLPGRRVQVPRPSYEVYRRTGSACRRCGAPVVTAVAAGRNLFWCPGCQTGPELRA